MTFALARLAVTHIAACKSLLASLLDTFWVVKIIIWYQFPEATIKATKKTNVPPMKRELKMRNKMRSMTAAASIQSFFVSSSSSAFSRSSAATRNLVSIRLQILISRSSVLLKSMLAWSLSGWWLPSRWSSSPRAWFLSSLTLSGAIGFDLHGFMRRYAANLWQMTFACITRTIPSSAS